MAGSEGSRLSPSLIEQFKRGIKKPVAQQAAAQASAATAAVEPPADKLFKASFYNQREIIAEPGATRGYIPGIPALVP